MSTKFLQVKNTCTTISILFDILILIEQLNLVNYAIDISNWNFKISGIGSFINTTYWWDEFYPK